MKNWVSWAVIATALLYALWFQRGPQQQPVELRGGSASLPDKRTIPYDKPAAPPSVSKPAPTFGGYPCAGDCTEDKAGYRWAEQNGITDPDDCTGNSGAFIEGCRVYAQQRAASSQKN